LTAKDLGELGSGQAGRNGASELAGPRSEAERGFLARMNVLVDRAGGATELARRTGLSKRVIDKYRAGESEPNRERLIRLAEGGGVSLAWLVTGHGSPETASLSTGEPDDDYIALPRYDVAAAAGSGAAVVREEIVDALYFRKDWLHLELGVNPSDLAIISAVGDSMAPTIEDGDLLVLEIGEGRWKSDGVYVIAVEDSVWVKRVARRKDGGLMISSDNPRYAHTTEEIARADLGTLRLVGRVMWVGGRI
jgi:phage repressor protein C with HTH and peptisase S24 domain